MDRKRRVPRVTPLPRFAPFRTPIPDALGDGQDLASALVVGFAPPFLTLTITADRTADTNATTTILTHTMNAHTHHYIFNHSGASATQASARPSSSISRSPKTHQPPGADARPTPPSLHMGNANFSMRHHTCAISSLATLEGNMIIAPSFPRGQSPSWFPRAPRHLATPPPLGFPTALIAGFNQDQFLIYFSSPNFPRAHRLNVAC